MNAAAVVRKNTEHSSVSAATWTATENNNTIEPNRKSVSTPPNEYAIANNGSDNNRNVRIGTSRLISFSNRMAQGPSRVRNNNPKVLRSFSNVIVPHTMAGVSSRTP